ncbi:Regulator of chromosome condensation (RCC1) repeat protein [Operophtera brumata]|uniref:Regulator of chromosome condensation (RCC1) repeat protein n=1 Tax=Operophtera brumata TaxID=104452 RepID=A0A0L7LBD5_OPEBR|nr:Regulator of chromosome condensation (RCC1) repeat protein [Operophtera brumata]
MIAGLVSWDLVAKRESNSSMRPHPNLYTFHKFTDRRYRFIASHCSAGHSVLISSTGEAYSFVYACGDNKSGQCGIGSTKAQLLKPTRIRHS